jgi:murein L,D-transpeptidase YafK
VRIPTRLLTLPVLFAATVVIFSRAQLKPEAPTKADKIVIEKAARKMSLYHKGAVLKTYNISLGGEPVGAKERQGDHRTPEGTYTISGRNAKSKFHRSLRISYPSAADRERAKKAGVDPGGDIMIHGLPNGWGWLGASHSKTDWTDGCIAVTNDEIEEIWELVSNGTTVILQP